MYEALEVQIVGLTPHIQHNGLLADPMNPWVQKIKSVTNKTAKQRTDTDFEDMAMWEFIGSLYVASGYETGQGGPVVIPGANVESMLRTAARHQKKGKQFEAGVMVRTDHELLYDGPQRADQLWDAQKYRFTVRACPKKNASVMRTRPIFRDWKFRCICEFLPGTVDEKAVIKAWKYAGQFVGMSDFRPRYGLFQVESIKKVKAA